jgi:hypothetical protein
MHAARPSENRQIPLMILAVATSGLVRVAWSRHSSERWRPGAGARGPIVTRRGGPRAEGARRGLSEP